MELRSALVHCHGVCGIRVPGQLASVHRCVHFDSELGTKKIANSGYAYTICSYISLAAASRVCSMCSISHPIRPGWSFGYISAANLISEEEEEEGEKEKRWRCLSLSLSCMRYFDPAATRQFFRAPAAALTRKCQGKGAPV